MIFCLEDFRCRLIETLDIIGPIDLIIKLVRGVQISKKRISLSWKAPSKFYISFKKERKRKRERGGESLERGANIDKNIRRSFLMIFCLEGFDVV